MELIFEWVTDRDTQKIAVLFNEETWSVFSAAAEIEGVPPSTFVSEAVVQKLNKVFSQGSHA